MPNRRTALTALLTLPFVSRFSFALETTTAQPAFKVGEKLTYSLGWQFIRAGKAITQVLPDEEVDGRKIRNFRMTAKTRRIVDRIYKVRDTLSSRAEYDVSRSLGYSKLQREGKTKRDITVDFDWEKKHALYFEALGGSRKTTPVPENALDPLSAFYFARNQKLEVGTMIKGPLTDGKKCKMAEIRVAAREKIKVKGTKYDTFKLIPDLKDVGGVFEKDAKATLTIWVTADHRHIPVQMKSKVAIGSFVAKLTHASNV